VAVQRDYYGQGEVALKALDKLNSLVETQGAPALRKLIDNPRNITHEDWVALSYLFANFAVRTPVIIDETRLTLLNLLAQVKATAERITERLKGALQMGSDLSEFPGEVPDDSPTMTLDQFSEEAAKLQTEEGHLRVASSIFGALVDIAKCIQRMTFLVVEAPRGFYFVTSDRPLVLRDRVTGSRIGVGWENANALGSIALHPNQFLLMFYDKPYIIKRFRVTPDQVTGFNLVTIMFANQEVYSPFKYPEADDWMKGAGRWGSQRSYLNE
jgi:hypothetical protein